MADADQAQGASGMARITVGDVVVDADNREVTFRGTPVVVSRTLFDALHYLARNSGRVVTKEELLEAVWPGRVVEEANVSQTVFALRKALARSGAREELITTAPGRGYKLSDNVKNAMIAAPAIPASTPTAPPHRSLPTRSWMLFGGVLLAMVILAGWMWQVRQPPAAPSKVVLADFTNRTGEAVFDDSLQQVLRTDLEQSPAVSVLTEAQVADALEMMTKPKTNPVTSAVASEICTRTNSTATLAGSITRLGGAYLIGLQARNCAGDQVIADELAQVASREAVVPGFDRLLSAVRSKLGESDTSIARYNVPMQNQKTASLDALKAYSLGRKVSDDGKPAAAIPMFQHAIEIDPGFAVAYADMGVAFAQLGQNENAKIAITKSHKLNSSFNQLQKLINDVLYNQFVTGNYNETEKSLNLAVKLYPLELSAWGNLANVETTLGHYSEAVDAGKRTVALAPKMPQAYEVLARALLRNGQLDEAAEICREAASKGVVGAQLASVSLEIDIAKNDSPAIARDLANAQGKPDEELVLLTAAMNAFRVGRVRLGDTLYSRASALEASRGMANDALLEQTKAVAGLGMLERARVLLAQVRRDSDTSQQDDIFLILAQIGDAGASRAIMAKNLEAQAEDTLLNAVFVPEAKATLALHDGHFGEALAVLQPAVPYEGRDYGIPLLRGQIYLAMGDGVHAAIEFHKIIDHPGILPEDEARSLAQLGLARALNKQNKTADARAEYMKFIEIFKYSDTDSTVFQQAKAELSSLKG